MKTFRVEVREVWVQTYFIEAKNAEEAMGKINSGADLSERKEGPFEFSHQLSKDTWSVEEKQTHPEA